MPSHSLTCQRRKQSIQFEQDAKKKKKFSCKVKLSLKLKNLYAVIEKHVYILVEPCLDIKTKCFVSTHVLFSYPNILDFMFLKTKTRKLSELSQITSAKTKSKQNKAK